ncbi:MAG: hypothetical protein M0Z54_07170 [Thermaerobacter sp.]|nr:hypothetical protein [Thermaerobacter sp.]
MPDSAQAGDLPTWAELLAITRDQVAAARAGDWGRVRSMMAMRRVPHAVCPPPLADEYWGAHQTLRELLGARLIALDAERARLAGAARWSRPPVAPLLVDRRD